MARPAHKKNTHIYTVFLWSHTLAGAEEGAGRVNTLCGVKGCSWNEIKLWDSQHHNLFLLFVSIVLIIILSFRSYGEFPTVFFFNYQGFHQAVFKLKSKMCMKTAWCEAQLTISHLLLEQVGIEGEKAVERVGVGGDTVARCRAADHRQHVAVVSLYDGVAEHHLVLPVTEKTQGLQWTISSGNFHVCFGLPATVGSLWWFGLTLVLSEGEMLQSSHGVAWNSDDVITWSKNIVVLLF